MRYINLRFTYLLTYLLIYKPVTYLLLSTVQTTVQYIGLQYTVQRISRQKQTYNGNL